MRLLPAILLFALYLPACLGVLNSADAADKTPVRKIEVLPPVKVIETGSPAPPAVEVKGYCCIAEKVVSVSSEDCQKENGRYFPTAAAADEACRKKGRLMEKPAPAKMTAPPPNPGPRKIRPVAPVAGGGTPMSLPPLVDGVDLRQTSWQWSAEPRVGGYIGASAILNISVTNVGTEPAAASRITFSVESAPDGASTTDLKASYDCPELGPGQSHNFGWPQGMSDATWKNGTYQFRFNIDKDNTVTETDEQNNQRTFTVTPKALALLNAGIQQQNTGVQIKKLDLSIEKTPPWPQTVLLEQLNGKGIFQANIQNVGNTVSPETTVALTWINTQTNGYLNMGYAPLPSLAPGEETTVQIKAGLPPGKEPGKHHVQMSIDPHLETQDVSRTNNHTEVIAVDFLHKADLTLFKPGESEYIPNRTSQPHKPVKMSFTVYNMTPDSYSGPLTVTLACDDQPVSTIGYEGIGGGGIGSQGGCDAQGHGCQTFQFTHEWSTTGTKKCEVSVAHQYGPQFEADPTNNKATFQVLILPDMASPL